MVKEGLTEEEALMYVIETNVLQRSFSDLLPSEKAAVLSMRYSKMFSQGKRNDIIAELSQLEGITMETETCGSDFHRSRSRDALGTDYDLTGRQIATYLRLDHLNDALKARLDAKLLTLASGVSLSYLDCDNQQLVAEELERWGQKLSDTQALALRTRGESGPLTQSVVLDILHKKVDRPKRISIHMDTYLSYFAPNTSKKEMERIVGEALALYFNQGGVSCDKHPAGGTERVS